jgi:hypothetical protein
MAQARALIFNCSVYNEANTSSKSIAPLYDVLASQLSSASRMTFTKVSVVAQATIAQSYNVTKSVPRSTAIYDLALTNV